ncbi:hypothetical protein HDU89_007828 [Geranomyces variabilis]|nr:hypothetical protein HDU89_007828 [Geranomyces variabilis]
MTLPLEPLLTLFAQVLGRRNSSRILLKRKRDTGELILPPSAAAYGYLPKTKAWKVDAIDREALDRQALRGARTAPLSDHRVLQDKRDNQFTAPTDVIANDGPEADDGRPDSPLAEADLADAPALVILADAQKLRDPAGKILEIEMRIPIQQSPTTQEPTHERRPPSGS